MSKWAQLDDFDSDNKNVVLTDSSNHHGLLHDVKMGEPPNDLKRTFAQVRNEILTGSKYGGPDTSYNGPPNSEWDQVNMLHDNEYKDFKDTTWRYVPGADDRYIERSKKAKTKGFRQAIAKKIGIAAMRTKRAIAPVAEPITKKVVKKFLKNKSKRNLMPKGGRLVKGKRRRKRSRKSSKRKAVKKFNKRVLKALQKEQPAYINIVEGTGPIQTTLGLNALWMPVATTFGLEATDIALAAGLNVAGTYTNYQYYISGSLRMRFHNNAPGRALLEIFTFRLKKNTDRTIDNTIVDPLEDLMTYSADDGASIIANYDIASSMANAVANITEWSNGINGGSKIVAAMNTRFENFTLFKKNWIIKKQASYNMAGGDHANYVFRWPGHKFRPQTDSAAATSSRYPFPVFHLFRLTAYPGLKSTAGVQDPNSVSTTAAQISCSYTRTDRIKPMLFNNATGLPSEVMYYSNLRPTNFDDVLVQREDDAGVAELQAN